MRLGFLTSGSVEDVQFACHRGFGCLEVVLLGEGPLLKDWKDFKAACDDHDVPVSAVSLFGQCYIGRATAAVRKSRKLLEAGAELACNLGARTLVSGSGLLEGVPVEEQWQMVVDAMGPMVAGVQERGLKFAFYNCHWANVVTTPEAWARVLPFIPGAGIKFDPSHPVYDGRDWMGDMWKAGRRIMHCHAKDTLRIDGKLIPDPNPGLGAMNWGAFFGILYELELDVDICIEPHSRVYGGERRNAALLLSKRYLEQFLMPEL